MVLLTTLVYCQEIKYLFMDDTSYYKVLKEDGYRSYCCDLNDSLPDGIYILFDVKRHESSNPNKRVIAKCQYLNNRKNGMYELSPILSPYLHIITSYSNGIKNGSEDIFFVNKCDSDRIDMVYHGEYLNGMREGEFIYYDRSTGQIDVLMLFNNDSLVRLSRYGLSNELFNKYDQILIDSDSSIIYTRFFFDSEIIKVDFYLSMGFLKYCVIAYINGEMQQIWDLDIDTHFTNPYQLPVSFPYISVENVLSKQSIIEYFSTKELNYIQLNVP